MVFWNYRLCVITPPGGVPPGWVSFGAYGSPGRDSIHKLTRAAAEYRGLGEHGSQEGLAWAPVLQEL